MSRISEHITFEEAIHSFEGKKLGISNIPTKEHVDSLKLLAENIFEPLREFVGGPIKINSMYRGELLNKAIKGSKTSQHVLGKAMDIDDVYKHKTNAEMFHFIKDNLDFDQLIWEYGNDKNPDWVHVSYNKGKNRKEILKAKKKAHGTHYEKY